MKKIIVIITFVLTAGSVSAQSYNDMMRQVIGRSSQLRALRLTLSSDSLAQRRGLNPMDPTASVEYFFGDNSFELTVEQSFDFPTVYHQRNKVAAHNIERAQANFKAAERELMLRASELYVTLTHSVLKSDVLTRWVEGLQRSVALSDTAVAAGAMTVLNLTKTKMILAATVSQLEQTATEQQQALNALEQMGATIDLKTLELPAFNFSGTQQDFVNAAMVGDFDIQGAHIDSLIAARALKLSRNEWAPQLVVGYRLEMEQGKARNALVAGISLPLWQNRGNVRHSKALVASTEASTKSLAEQKQVTYANLYDGYQAATRALEQWQGVDMQGFERMLDKSYQAGAITALEYLLELSDYYKNCTEMLDYQQSQALLGATISIVVSD